MKKLSKAIIIFSFLLLNISCDDFIVGNIRIIAANFPEALGSFNFVREKERIIIKGKLNDEFFTGDVYSVTKAQKVEMIRYPDVPKHIIKQKNIFAFARLTGNRNNIIECFIRQNSNRKFYIGGVGRCYHTDGRTFDILLEDKRYRIFSDAE